MKSTLTKRLLDARNTRGHWQGSLASSALATATAAFALYKYDPAKYTATIQSALTWLATDQNPDGGWGDSPQNTSNISTTLLCYAALTAAANPNEYSKTISAAENWLTQKASSLNPADIAKAVDTRYGNDKTFSVPILTMTALSNCLSAPLWPLIKPLPFELAALPHRLFKWLNLNVVSYALPALIAIGQTIHHHKKPTNPITRILRSLIKSITLKKLQHIQPKSGGYLEAIPLTSFVTMSLIAAGHKAHPVVTNAVKFLESTLRPDGSWPIDTNLATWLTTLSINAMPPNALTEPEKQNLKNFLLSQQFKTTHPFTKSPPGGWGWTNSTGALPDADDTAGAILALHKLAPNDPQTIKAATLGIQWLINLQNSDHGTPTFCKGWLKLPFDKSGPDLTAHAIAAIAPWLNKLPKKLKSKAHKSITNALTYLKNTQHQTGSWLPLWFGSDHTPNQSNPTYGTAKIAQYLSTLPKQFANQTTPMITKAAQYLLSAQNTNGSFGPAPNTPPSIEETALAITALKSTININQNQTAAKAAIKNATTWLIEATNKGQNTPPAPIGLYFAKLAYHEDLYPLIFATQAAN